MGCTNSKNQTAPPLNPLEYKPKDLTDARPDALRRDITEKFKWYVVKRDRIKPLLAEKYGIAAMIEEEREKLMPVLVKKDDLYKQRQPFMEKTWERDADDIHKAFSKFSTDKSILVNILCARTYWQIDCIAEVYERKYNAPLLQKVVNEMTTMLGSLLTGSGTGLSKLLTYRILPQGERDAAILRDCSDGIGLDDQGLLEVICTRSNVELRTAMEEYQRHYKKDLVEIVRSKSSYKNYREFVLKILECNHDEDNEVFPDDLARQYAKELYDAGAGRTIGMDPEPFIRILANVSRKQFESINQHYPSQQLVKDITAKLGGDFQLAVLTRCQDKYEYLASRIENALKGFSPDKETLSRILGCLSRPECVKVKLAYGRMGYKRTLEEAIRSVLKSQLNYMNACLLLISEDMSVTPLGSDKEIVEEEIENAREAERLALADYMLYKPEKAQERGEAIMTLKRKANKKFKLKTDMENGESAPDASAEEQRPSLDEPQPVGAIEDSNLQADPQLAEEDRILALQWDGKGRFMDVTKLTATYRELEYADNQASMMLDKLGDEIQALLEVYKTLLKHRFETEAFMRNYSYHIRCLKEFNDNRDSILAAFGSNTSKKR